MRFEALEVLLVLPVVVGGLHTVGLEQTWAAAQLPVEPAPVDVDALLRWVRRASRRVPGAGRCLPRALTAAVLLRRRGVSGELLVGVRSRPFAAHAWLLVDGEVRLGAGPASEHTPIWSARW